MACTYLKVPNDFFELTVNLSKEEQGELLLGMLIYASSGKETKLSDNTNIAWPYMRKLINNQMKAYKTKAANGSLGGRGHKNRKKV